MMLLQSLFFIVKVFEAVKGGNLRSNVMWLVIMFKHLAQVSYLALIYSSFGQVKIEIMWSLKIELRNNIFLFKL